MSDKRGRNLISFLQLSQPPSKCERVRVRTLDWVEVDCESGLPTGFNLIYINVSIADPSERYDKVIQH